MPAEHIMIEIAGESVQLFAARALFWPARRRLVIADLHLGKGEVFRKAGISLPHGGTRADLARLSWLIEACSAASVWVLGDLVHGPVPDKGWRDAWNEWRARHANVGVAGVLGNHDRAVPRSGLQIDLLPDRVTDGPLRFQHEPSASNGSHIVCGHLHPITALPGLGGRWPTFWLRDQITVLPAFSAFTAGVPVAADGHQRLAVCARDQIVLVDCCRS